MFRAQQEHPAAAALELEPRERHLRKRRRQRRLGVADFHDQDTVRLEVRGSTIDLLAVALEDASFEPKEEVIVIEMDGTRVKVAKLTPERLSKP